jgi:hypothetical protein
MTTSLNIKPWYREPWPWLLALGPFIVVIAGIYTAYLAIVSNDGLVTDDYYKKGLVVNQTIASSEQARKLGLTVGVRMTEGGFVARLAAADQAFAMPPLLVLTLSHPTRAGLDQSLVLKREGDAYAGQVRLPKSGHWLVLVEDETKSWRLMGNVVLPAAGETIIGGETADVRK